MSRNLQALASQNARRAQADSRTQRFQQAAIDRQRGEGILKAAREAQEQIKAIPAWDQLNEVYITCRAALGLYNGIEAYKGRKDVFAAMTPAETQEFTQLARTFGADLLKYTNDLQAIYALHQGKTGHLGEDPDMTEVAITVQLFEQYDNFRQQAESVLGGSYIHMMEILHSVETRMGVAAENAAQDPNVVTDVTPN